MLRTLRKTLPFLLIPATMLALVKLFYGGGERREDLTRDPIFAMDQVEKVADLHYPPGNIAVSSRGRIFFTFHPQGHPPIKLAELVDGQVRPYPNKNFQRSPSREKPLGLVTPLGLRIDAQNRLWVLDHGRNGSDSPQIIAFDLETNQVVHHHKFGRSTAPVGSHLNDLQVHSSGQFIFISEASLFRKDPAIIVYDVAKKQSKRVLSGHVSVQAANYMPVVEGQELELWGLFTVNPGVDSIALTRDDQYLYFSSLSSLYLYRIETEFLIDPNLPTHQLPLKVEKVAIKTMSDGMSTDLEGNIYLTDPEHGAILMLDGDHKLHTLVKSNQIPWPEGLSFGPQHYLYITSSALHRVLLQSRSVVLSQGPYSIFRFAPGAKARPGH